MMGRAASVIGREQALAVLDILREAYPTATCELDFSSAFQLLVATILSAQSTDRGVNRVTPELFGLYPGSRELAAAPLDEVERIVRPTGFYRVKADTIIRAAREVESRFAGRVPDTLDELVTLPGVGRKTANVVLGEWYGVPGITTDTHVLRLSRRLGWSENTDPVKVEKDLAALFPSELWISMCRVTIWHGRRRCHARRPACGACPVGGMCPSYGEGETDPGKAAALIR